MKHLVLAASMALTACVSGAIGLSDPNIAEKGQKRWVDPSAGKGLDHPLVSTLGVSGLCCVPLEPYNSTVRQFEIIGKRQTISSAERTDLFDIKFDDGYGAGVTQRAFIRQSDLHLFPRERPVPDNLPTASTRHSELIGRTFWVNPKGIPSDRFRQAPDLYGQPLKFDRKAKFAVVGSVKGRTFGEWLRVQFEDGRDAYIEASAFSVADPQELGNRVFADPIFPDDPDKVRANLERRGGVAVGMTKAQVLKSNWGKPASVHTTVVRGVEHEQWRYSSESYLYFKNGVLTGIQTTSH